MAAELTPKDCLITYVDKHGKVRIVGVNTEKASDMLLHDYKILHVVDNKETFMYKNGVYCRDAYGVLKQMLYKAFKGIETESGKPVMIERTANEILTRTCSMTSATISSLQADKRLLDLANCVLDLDSMDEYDHSPDYKLLTKLPVRYDFSAGCPLFMKFLGQAIDTKYFDVVGEMIGYTLWPDYNAHKAFMFLGPKRTGKSTLIRVIEALNGHSNCSHVSLQDLVSQRFARARLFGNRINTYGDLPATAMSDVGIFKNVTGEDEIDAEYKGTQIFSFRNIAKWHNLEIE